LLSNEFCEPNIAISDEASEGFFVEVYSNALNFSSMKSRAAIRCSFSSHSVQKLNVCEISRQATPSPAKISCQAISKCGNADLNSKIEGQKSRLINQVAFKVMRANLMRG
jgi:hypothetical protein